MTYMDNNNRKQAFEFDRFVELSSELARIALECPTCRGLFKQAIENHSHRGGPSTDANRLTEGNNYNDNSRS